MLENSTLDLLKQVISCVKRTCKCRKNELTCTRKCRCEGCENDKDDELNDNMGDNIDEEFDVDKEDTDIFAENDIDFYLEIDDIETDFGGYEV